MKTGNRPATVLRTTAASSGDARQRLLQWILASEAKRRQIRESARIAAMSPGR